MTTFTVTTLLDENDPGETANAPHLGTGLSLREALALANASPDADRITFDAALLGGTVFLTSGEELAITTSLTIDGDIDGDGKADIQISADHSEGADDATSRVLSIDSSGNDIAVALNALVIRDGKIFGSGAGIFLAFGDALVLTNSTFTGNDASTLGGGILNVGTLTVTNTTVRDNSAFNGGGIDNTGTMVLTNVTIADNSASTGGGVLNTGSAVLTNVTAAGNSASGSGGGIYHFGGTLTFANSIVAGNDASSHDDFRDIDGTATFSGVNVFSQSGVGDAEDLAGVAVGDIFATVAVNALGVTSGVLADNGGVVQTIAIKADGVARDAGDATQLNEAVVHRDLNGDGDQTDAIATDARGLVRVVGPNVDIGAFEAGNLLVTTLDDELDARDIDPATVDLSDLSLREAIALANANPDANHITFAQNLAGGTVFLTTGQELLITTSLTIDGDIDGDGKADIQISADHSEGADDATTRVFNIDSPSGDIAVALNGLVIRDGKITGFGAGIFLASGDALVLTHSTITGNAATGLASGGGIFNLQGTLTVENATISKNSAFDGGGINNNVGGTMVLTNVTIADNSAVSSGGGVINWNSAFLTNVTVAGNKASVSGGGIYNDATATLTLTNSIVAGNDASAGSDIDGTPTFLGVNVVGTGGDADATDHVINTPTLADLFATVEVNGLGVNSGVLADNGGAVQTIALKESATNPAVDAGDATLLDESVAGRDLNGDGDQTDVIATDARGLARVAGAGVDIGAFEAQAEASSLVVTTLDDVVDPFDNLTSLREAIAYANSNPGADIITFSTTGTIRLASALPVISEALTIDGDNDDDGVPDILITGDVEGDDETTIVSGVTVTDIFATFAHQDSVAKLADNVRIFEASADLTLNGLVLTGGVTTGDGGAVSGGATVTLTNTTVSGNSAGGGGGGVTANSATLINTTVSGNSSGNDGGGVFANTANLTNTTVSGNSAGLDGGGVWAFTANLASTTVSGNSAGTSGGGVSAIIVANLTNSIVLGNDAAGPGDETLGTLNPAGLNIVGVGGDTDAGDGIINAASAGAVFAQTVEIAPGIFAGVLADNGGPVWTIALKQDSANPALDGSDASAPATDARGQARVDLPGVANANDTAADLGAFELLLAAPTDIALSNASVDEASANGTIVGALSATDPDTGDSFSFSLVDDAGGRFGISGTNLVVANGSSLDFETSASHNVTVRVTDSGGFTFDKPFTISITDVDEAPPLYNWQASGDLGAHPSGYQVAGIGDFNGDGTADVLWRNAAGQLDEWRLLNGNWSASINPGTHTAAETVAGIGDFNGDGIDDLLWRNPTTGHLEVSIMLDGQMSSTIDLGSHGADWKVLGIGDFDGDGDSDILFQHTTTGAVDEWIMENGNWSQSISLGSHNTAYTRAAIGDFDGDGTDDVLWQNPTNGAVEQWHMQNGNWAGSIGLGSHNPAYEIAAVNDFNDDGTSDILWRNPTSGAVEGWVMDDGNWFASVSLGSFNTAWTLAGTGDFNDAGGADVLWHNPATGQVGTWLLDTV